MSNSESLWCVKNAGSLSGLRVVDFGQYIAGPLTAMMLADQGADVIRVDPPGGPRWNTPVNATLLRGRRTIILNLHDEPDRTRAQRLIATADVVIENFRPGVADRLGIGAAACLKLAPRLVYCSLPGFGADDPRAGIAAWEGVVMAAAGGYSLRGPTGALQTAFSPLCLGSVFAAMEAATAVTAALVARERDGLGQHVEVPLFDALFEASGATSMSVERSNASMVDFAPGWYLCADGKYANLISLWFRHYENFLRAAGCESWIEEGLATFDRLRTDSQAKLELRARLVELFKTRPAHEWEELGRACGSTIAVARSMTEWMDEPHALTSGTLVDTWDPVLGSVRVPGRAIHVSTSPDTIAAPRRRTGSDNTTVLPLLDALVAQDGAATQAGAEAKAQVSPSREPPLAGFKALDFARVVAGPTSGRLLAQLGADVIKIDTTTADARAMTQLPIGHGYVNRGKRSIDLDLASSEGAKAVADLFATADIVIQNFTLGVAERLAICEHAAKKENPNLIYVYLNAYGRRGPWSTARGYAELANTATGITERVIGERVVESGAHSLTFDLPRWPFTDFAGGVLGAFGAVLGLYERVKSGIAPSVETSLIRATTLEQINYLIAYQGRDITEPRGAEQGWSPYHRLYETADGTVFIGAGRDQEGALLQAVGASDIQGLAIAVKRHSTAAVQTVLAERDIGVHPVETVTDLMRPGGPASQRGIRIEDQTEAFGTVAMVGPIARLSRTPLVAGKFPRPFGAETAEILTKERSIK